LSIFPPRRRYEAGPRGNWQREPYVALCVWRGTGIDSPQPSPRSASRRPSASLGEMIGPDAVTDKTFLDRGSSSGPVFTGVGWTADFGLADSSFPFGVLDGWLRSRLRQVRWKEWKRPPTREREVRQLGISARSRNRRSRAACAPTPAQWSRRPDLTATKRGRAALSTGANPPQNATAPCDQHQPPRRRLTDRRSARATYRPSSSHPPETAQAP
jgi:Group II intron, maturase-specific domain